MSAPAVAPKSHAELGASVASRWMACPGSVQLCRTVPVPPSTSFAEEGTRAHALGELCLRRGVDPDFFVGMELEGGPVTDDMAEFVRVYVDYCRELMVEPSQHWIEQKFNLAVLDPPGPMFGTGDFTALQGRTLHVVDLKYGQGVVIEAKGNKQLRYYALGALLKLGEPHDSLDHSRPPIDQVVMTIVQPRVSHPDGVIRSEVVTIEELLGFAGDLMDAARATQKADAPLVPGSHCKFCPAAGICPAQRDHVQALAQIEFAAVPLEAPRPPETLTDAELVSVLKLVPMLEDWASAVRAHAQGRLERGESLPGLKLVEGRSNRKWGDEETAKQYFLADGLTLDEITQAKLKSPAQMEKVVGKKNVPGDLIVKPAGKLHLVPDSDPRPAVVITPGEEFPALPVGPGEE